MNVVYTLSTGKQVSIFLTDDLYQGKPIRETVDVQPLFESLPAGKEFSAKIFSEADGRIFFVCDREKVFIQDFNFLTVEEMVKKAENGERLFKDKMCATFLKDTQNVGLVHDGNTYVPIETPRYPKALWYHKIILDSVTSPHDEMCRDYYFSDLCQHINSGVFRLVNLSTHATSSN